MRPAPWRAVGRGLILFLFCLCFALVAPVAGGITPVAGAAPIQVPVGVADEPPIQGIVRLHVVAHDDTPASVLVKAAVRDAVLSAVRALVPNPGGPAQVRTAVLTNLPLLHRCASAAARAASPKGGEAPVIRISYGVSRFPEKVYDPGPPAPRLVLPAGPYEALQVRIGAGRGSNWWCMLFPPLCLRAFEGSGSPRRPALSDVPGTATAASTPASGDLAAGLLSWLFPLSHFRFAWPASVPLLYLLPR